ncbi:MAG TPA: MYXO-CTERM sorting domain-containing protein, partial [Kofleriaceae bacterium]
MRRLVLVLCLVFASKAYAADEDNAPPDTAFDPTVDECAAPDAGCVPEVDVDDATLAQQEVAAPTMIDPIVWEGSGAMLCPDGATVQDGACVAGGTVAAQPAGCNASGAGLVVIVAVAGLFVIARRRRLLLALAIAACAQDASYDWDSVVDDGALSGDYVDVFSADL